jgi:hypothetical protein
MSTQAGCALLSFSFDGLDQETGPVSVPGLKVGDVVLAGSWGSYGFSGSAGIFEGVVTVADEIQQVDGADNLTGIVLVIARPC